MNIEVVILAAGKGSRMYSASPKVLQKLAGTSLISRVVKTAQSVGARKPVVVTGYEAKQVEKHLHSENISFVKQKEQLGTAHAVSVAVPKLKTDSIVVILYGDVPCIEVETIKVLISKVSSDTIGLLTVNIDSPGGYGRIVRDSNNSVQEIVEQKDASPDQLRINEVNTGVIALTDAQLKFLLPKINNQNAQKEYYLTDIIKLARASGLAVKTVSPSQLIEVQGVNDKKQLSNLERSYQLMQAQNLMDSGTTIADPNRFDQRGTLSAGADCFIDINCIFEGENVLGSEVHIEPNCLIIDSEIADGARIKANSIIEKSHVHENSTIGPYARLRPDTKVMPNAKVGNFVEIKNSMIGDGSKVNHLAYVGDAILERDVNIGAGTITCNYDGTSKHKTSIGENVFIGSNSTLVAPVHIKDGAFVGAGSTITIDVPNNCLGIGRSKQKNIENWQRPKK